MMIHWKRRVTIAYFRCTRQIKLRLNYSNNAKHFGIKTVFLVKSEYPFKKRKRERLKLHNLFCSYI